MWTVRDSVTISFSRAPRDRVPFGLRQYDMAQTCIWRGRGGSVAPLDGKLPTLLAAHAPGQDSARCSERVDHLQLLQELGSGTVFYPEVGALDVPKSASPKS